ncbi:MAG TPA: ABC-2 family transporter protein, partial [Clostridia bacterium]|nr:ABC-2 family transporter protein [Clostridia bacterium]
LSNCTIGYVRHIGLSLVILVISISSLQIVVTPLKLLMLIIFVLGGSLIQAGFYLIFSAPNFWMVRGENILTLFFFQVSDFVQYPITIYPLILQGMLTFVLPYAFINFYPAQYFLGKNDFSIFNPVLQFLTPIVGIVVFLFGVWFWNWSLKKYQSTGT